MNIKRAREALGLTQTEMAAAMGVHRGLWLKWERNEQRMTAAPVRLLDLLGLLHADGRMRVYLDRLPERYRAVIK